MRTLLMRQCAAALQHAHLFCGLDRYLRRLLNEFFDSINNGNKRYTKLTGGAVSTA